MEIDVAFQMNWAGEEFTGGNNDAAATGGMAGSDGFAYGVTARFRAVANSAEFDDFEIAGGKSNGGHGERGSAEPVTAGHVHL